MEELKFIDYFTIASSLAVVIGVIFGFITWRKSMVIKRAEYVHSLREKFFDDKDVADVIYTVEYDEQWYDYSFHGGSEMERKVDKTLSVCDYVCYLYGNKLISEKEFELFEYDLCRIFNNNGVLKYMDFLSHWSNDFLNIKFPFSQLEKFGQKYLKKDVSSSNSSN